MLRLIIALSWQMGHSPITLLSHILHISALFKIQLLDRLNNISPLLIEIRSICGQLFLLFLFALLNNLQVCADVQICFDLWKTLDIIHIWCAGVPLILRICLNSGWLSCWDLSQDL
jgi:hypothetical protein